MHAQLFAVIMNIMQSPGRLLLLVLPSLLSCICMLWLIILA